jgi:hypothetical protein
LLLELVCLSPHFSFNYQAGLLLLLHRNGFLVFFFVSMHILIGRLYANGACPTRSPAFSTFGSLPTVVPTLSPLLFLSSYTISLSFNRCVVCMGDALCGRALEHLHRRAPYSRQQGRRHCCMGGASNASSIMGMMFPHRRLSNGGPKTFFLFTIF